MVYGHIWHLIEISNVVVSDDHCTVVETKISTRSAFGRGMSHVELWLALRASYKCCQHMAGPLGQPYVYINKKNPNILATSTSKLIAQLSVRQKCTKRNLEGTNDPEIKQL